MTALTQWIALERTYSWGARWDAWHLLPKRARLWVIVRAHADATAGQLGNVHPGDVKAFDLTERMS